MIRNILSVLIVVLVSLVLASCSGKSMPTSADLSGSNLSGNPEITDSTIRDANLYPGVFGAWKVHVDTQTLEAEILPARNAGGIGAIFDADLLQFLTVSPCTNCLRIPGVLLDSYGDINVRVQMKHPFGDIAKRPDLHGFDVRAIFIVDQNDPKTFDKIMVMKPDGTEEPAQINSVFSGLLNADGFTSHFDNIVTDARYFPGGADVPGNLNPFLRYFESYSTDPFDPKNPTGHNVMKVGAGFYERVAVFDDSTASNGLTFYIVADVAYGQSATLSNRQSPQYYLPSFNRTEPWRVEYWLENNTLEGGNVASTADVFVQVFDWQQGFSVDPSYPNPTNLTGLKESSNVAKVDLYVPDIMDGFLTATTPDSGLGTPESPLQYEFTITNEKGSYNDAMGLLAVRDELNGHASPSGRMPIPDTPAGFPYNTEDIRDYSIYYPIFIKFQKNVMSYYWDQNTIDGELFIPGEEYLISNYTNPHVKLHPTYYSDLGHKKYQYRWDLNYDGVTFDIDASGLPSPELTFTEGGRHNIGLRIRTNSKPVHETIFTIPVFKEGIGYSKSPFTSGAATSMSSPQGNHAVAMTSDKFYSVCTREIAGNREIWLITMDRQGNVVTEQVTSEPEAAWDPSIWVIEDGPGAGIYIAYLKNDVPNGRVFFTKKPFGGSFTTPTFVENLGNQMQRPIIVYFNDKLLIYYNITSLALQTLIDVAHSDNFGDTWLPHGAKLYNDINTNNQLDYSVTIYSSGLGGDQLFIVWSDDVNYGQTGYDLWLGTSTNGIDFTTRCISSFPGNVDEYASSTTCGSEDIAIAYLVKTAADPKPYAHLKVVHRLFESNADWPLSTWYLNSNQTFTRPCITFASSGIYLVSYGVYDTNTHTLEAHLDRAVETIFPGRFEQYSILNNNAGVVDPANNGAEIYPCVGSFKEVYQAAEGFLVYRQVNDGYVTSGINPKIILGDLEAVYFAAQGYRP